MICESCEEREAMVRDGEESLCMACHTERQAAAYRVPLPGLPASFGARMPMGSI
ncbi:hypothetical protein [Sporosarcina trichiuri]|uniref:hypothetical protein n=1 Tax=Sporosarcina trichiuri TaxID=3056445 RepID=UPI0025B330DA|nr:hypothetical protein [Sporosarcina sp. 0.2-SM1T-5]WJY26375.1 hypothetical protein QWT68_09790 [Sporosarcina sp. 0.2-SM1T-5]